MPEPMKRDIWHEVQPNEDVQIICADYGIKDWRSVYAHEKNADLREKRPDPRILYKGDKLWIPEITPEEFEVRTNKKHTFTLYYPKVLLQLTLRNDQGEPYGGVKYEIRIDGEKFNPSGKEEELKTRSDGLVHHMVPVAREIQLRIWYPKEDREADDRKPADDEYETIVFNPGYLDPIDTTEGVQDRLINLQYDIHPDGEGEYGPGTKKALRKFQKDYGLVPSGRMDKMTLKKLVSVHGS